MAFPGLKRLKLELGTMTIVGNEERLAAVPLAETRDQRDSRFREERRADGSTPASRGGRETNKRGFLCPEQITVFIYIYIYF